MVSEGQDFTDWMRRPIILEKMEVHRQEFWIRGMDMFTTLRERKEIKPV